MTDANLATEWDAETAGSVADRVARGIALLDETFPDGWADWIYVADLDIGNSERCVLGQLAARWPDDLHETHRPSEYGDVVDLLGWTSTESAAHGFTVWGWPDDRDNLDALQEVWEREISARQSTPAGA